VRFRERKGAFRNGNWVSGRKAKCSALTLDEILNWGSKRKKRRANKQGGESLSSEPGCHVG